MSKRSPRFEIVRSDAGWFARFRAANGKEVWRTSETYERRRGAMNALDCLAETFGRRPPDRPAIKLRFVDERP